MMNVLLCIRLSAASAEKIKKGAIAFFGAFGPAVYIRRCLRRRWFLISLFFFSFFSFSAQIGTMERSKRRVVARVASCLFVIRFVSGRHWWRKFHIKIVFFFVSMWREEVGRFKCRHDPMKSVFLRRSEFSLGPETKSLRLVSHFLACVLFIAYVSSCFEWG